MRLIDSIDLWNHIEKQMDEYGDAYEGISVQSDIDMGVIPTVEAIPVEWLNSWLERNKSIVIGMSDYAFSKMLMDFKKTVYGRRETE